MRRRVHVLRDQPNLSDSKANPADRNGLKQCPRSGFLHPSNAIACGADGSFNNRTTVITRNEMEAVAALLVSVRLVLILHRLLRSLLLRKCILASNHACS